MSAAVKAGYKQTEVGVIPEEWETASIGEVTEIRVGRDLKEEWFSPFTDSIYKFPVYSNTVSDEGLYGFYSHQEYEGDSLTVVGRGVGLGTAFARQGGYGAIGRLLVLLPDHRVDSQFLTTYINQRVSIFVETGGIPQLTGIQFSKYKVALPPLPEQRAIATALSDVDALLDGLERLIAKKRDLKQAAMQQLLTGQTRLPGFCGEWEVKRLGEIGEISGAGVDKKTRQNEAPVRLLNYMDVYKKDFLESDDFWHEVTARPDQARRCSVQRGDIFFTPTSEVREDIGHTAVAIEDITDVVYSYHVVRLRLFENWDVRFRAYVFKIKDFMDQASTQCEGSGTRYVITLPKFRSMKVRFPRDVKEQTAIAAVLSDMDAELAALEARRDKTRALKQAMMQELLTGKTRLVSPEVAHA